MNNLINNNNKIHLENNIKIQINKNILNLNKDLKNKRKVV